MQELADNWFFIALILLCIGMHLFGHGHAGHRPSDEEESDDLVPRHRKNKPN